MVHPGDPLTLDGLPLLFEAEADAGWTVFALAVTEEAQKGMRHAHKQGMFYQLEGGSYRGTVVRVAAVRESEKRPRALRVRLELDMHLSAGLLGPFL
jgi:hypothetical protein